MDNRFRIVNDAEWIDQYRELVFGESPADVFGKTRADQHQMARVIYGERRRLRMEYGAKGLHD